jgi:hypothetical protein
MKLYSNESLLSRYYFIQLGQVYLTPYCFEFVIAEYYKSKFTSNGNAKLRNRVVVDLGQGKEEYDILMEVEMNGEVFNFIMECKYYNLTAEGRTVTRNDVRLFSARAQNLLPTAKTILVANCDFDSSAILEAKYKQMKLVTVTIPQKVIANAARETILGHADCFQFGARVNAREFAKKTLKEIEKGSWNIGLESYFASEEAIHQIIHDKIPKSIKEFVIYEPKLSNLQQLLYTLIEKIRNNSSLVQLLLSISGLIKAILGFLKYLFK